MKLNVCATNCSIPTLKSIVIYYAEKIRKVQSGHPELDIRVQADYLGCSQHPLLGARLQVRLNFLVQSNFYMYLRAPTDQLGSILTLF